MENGGGRTSIFCISSYEKGQAFLQEAARLGCEVRLLTVEKLKEGDWPRESLAELLTMPEGLTPEQVLHTVCWLARERRIDRVVPLDEFDLEAAALIRGHMQLSGLDESTTRLFRDKFAMRTRAKERGIAVPEFCGVFNYAELDAFMRTVRGPWLLKPRTNASAIGIRRIERAEELWPVLEELGDLGSHHLLERFVPGEVFHMEGVTWEGEVLFGEAFVYGKPPIQTMHQGGVFTTRTLPQESEDARAMRAMQTELMGALGLWSGVTHTEFIKAAEDGQFYFLETAARVGGAYIADTVELARGLNPWVEWARMEVAAARGEGYRLPELREEYAGAVISLARQQEPDLSAYADAEVAVRLHKTHHAGILLRSASEERLRSLVESYGERFARDFCAVLPAPEKATA